MSVQDPKNSFNNQTEDDNTIYEDLEVEAAISFINKIANNFTNTCIKFHVCRLTDAINQACMVDLDRRKILCLYLHNSSDKFSTAFCEYLKNMEVIEILNRSFFFLGWDVEETKYQGALINALNKCNDLSILIDMLASKISAILCIVPIKDSIIIFSCIKGKVSDKDFLMALSNAEKFLIAENQEEKSLEDLVKKTRSENDIDSFNYHQIMADMLGDRDYDRFEHNQHDYLKKKIAFATLGPPQKEEGYEKKDMKKVEGIYNNILKNSNAIAKYKDTVEISFIYNCTEPLPSEKLSRAKKYKEEYNPNTDVMPVPIFVLRKCRGSINPCRVFVDNTGRTYSTWQEYIRKNKLHKCEMILPQDGRYEVGENDEVLLEKFLSPVCGIDSKLLQGADYLNAAGGLVSGGIFVAAAIPTIAVAPAAIVAGGIIGLGVGIYSLGRGAYTLYDRKKHKETLNFVNSEARGAYLNIVASSLGFVGAGATVVVSQLASMGVNIGQGAGAALKTIGLAKMSADSLSMLNKGCDIIYHWCTENKASLLTIVQLRSSILFFGNVAYSFEMDEINLNNIRTLQQNQESLRNNRYRKAFLKLQIKSSQQNKQKNTEGVVEVISSIQEIPDKDQVHDVLLRSNDTFNNTGVNFFKYEGELKLNDIKIDVDTFFDKNKKHINGLLSNYAKSDPTQLEIDSMCKIISETLNNYWLPNVEVFAIYVIQLLSAYSDNIKLKIIEVVAFFLAKISKEEAQILDILFPNQYKYFSITNMIIYFFGEKAHHMEEKYNMWTNTQDQEHYHSVFKGVDEDSKNRILTFFENSINSCYEQTSFTEKAAEDLLIYFYCWFAEQIYFYQIKTETKMKKKEHSSASASKKVDCNVCGGYYYQNT